MNEMKAVSGHRLEIGDKVKMNIEAIGNGDLDGVEFTATGKNYWRYMNQHPEEIYTVVDYDFSGEETSYILSGEMSENNWYPDELILIPEPKTYFEAIKCMDIDEMAKFLSDLFRINENLVQGMLNDKYVSYNSISEKHATDIYSSLGVLKVDTPTILANLLAKRHLGFNYVELEKYVEYLRKNSPFPIEMDFSEEKLRETIQQHSTLYGSYNVRDTFIVFPTMVPRLDVFNSKYDEAHRTYIQNVTNDFLHKYYEGGSRPEWASDGVEE